MAAGEFAAGDAGRTGFLLHRTMIVFSHPTLIEQGNHEDLPAIASEMAEFVLRALRRSNDET
jgi:hypothetical protein